MERAIRNINETPEYQQGYSEGYAEGYNKALVLFENLMKNSITNNQPVIKIKDERKFIECIKSLDYIIEPKQNQE